MSGDNIISFQTNRLLHYLIVWLMFFWLVMAFNPLNRQDWMLENIMVIAYVVVLVVSYHRFQFSNTSYLLFTLFMSLHLVGAHYTYAETPLGYWMQDWFGLQRNHYDRLIHFSFGMLLAYPIRELLIRAAKIKISWSYTNTVLIILSMGAVFEIFEMWAAMLVSPELGDAYLGTQGDVWDAQQDMLLATLGAICTMAITHLLEGKSGPDRHGRSPETPRPPWPQRSSWYWRGCHRQSPRHLSPRG